MYPDFCSTRKSFSPFIKCSSVVVGIVTKLCNDHNNQIQNIFITPKRNLIAFVSHSPFLLFPSPWCPRQALIYSFVSIGLSVQDMACEQNHAICSLLWLVKAFLSGLCDILAYTMTTLHTNKWCRTLLLSCQDRVKGTVFTFLSCLSGEKKTQNLKSQAR